MAAPVIATISPSSAVAGSASFTLVVAGNNLTPDATVEFGGTALTTTFVGSTQVTASVPSSAFASLSVGGLDVHVVSSAGISNSVSFAVTAQPPFSVADINALVSSITVPALANLSSAANQYVKTIDYIQTYQVKDGDTVQSIAANIAGNASYWQDIVFINSLRYPFISNNPQAQTGSNNYSLVLAARVNPGDTQVSFNGISPFVTPGAVLFFSVPSPLSNGTARVISDVATIDAVDVYASTLTLDSPVFNTYVAGTSVDVLTTYNNSSSRVVGPGDLILVPSQQNVTSLIKNGNIDLNNLYAILGEDIMHDGSGFLSGDGSGDLLTVSGIGNLGQAVQDRLVTELGELSYHPTYGNALLKYVGHINSHELAILANREIAKTLSQEPRIQSLSNTQTTVVGDVLSVSTTANIAMFNTSQNFVFQINTATGSATS